MALTATIYTIEIDLNDSDRGVYESLALRVARHPSESEDTSSPVCSRTRSSTRKGSSFRGASPILKSRRSPYQISPDD